VQEVANGFRAFRNDFDTNSENLRPILAQQMRITLNNVHGQLDSDLNQVPITTNILKAEIGNVDITYDEMWNANFQNAFAIDTAITNAVNEQVQYSLC
jgi:hypothetical protein